MVRPVLFAGRTVGNLPSEQGLKLQNAHNSNSAFPTVGNLPSEQGLKPKERSFIGLDIPPPSGIFHQNKD